MKKPAAASNPTPATTPITMPAMAPPERPPLPLLEPLAGDGEADAESEPEAELSWLSSSSPSEGRVNSGTVAFCRCRSA